nr:MAG TPA: hypothetical protein [Caudoviricetes sp.]
MLKMKTLPKSKSFRLKSRLGFRITYPIYYSYY